ncbi:MAG: thioredoxin domain-containing protein [Thalassospira sp.]|uniref:DsbA family protein n=1 Tax=Thalassospira sp. TaxID=1912094 RepID=UPI001B1E2D67|nr:DsbA family protein [Thalassospira sp.]MBO6579858.1 thioredoxin domain-containing protein [Thalassospira sp.]MBO6804925.1 thioredoxin domain-containing protein [Thalassospira sp.]MBO6819220.1 thioredoxin domain-containing protein [Thalassospira sp.]MBO6888483.1 thioredoxin domain-containing protein [Thalassospira sp.]
MNSHIAKRFLAGTALGIGMLIGAPAAFAQDSLSTEQKTEIEGVIEQYLLDNPDVLLRAIQNVQSWQAAEQSRQQAAAITPVWDALVADSSVPSVGPVNAPVTVIEFFDYHCGYCKRAFDGVKEIAENSDGKVRTIFVEFPILSEESTLAARAALAADKQDKYMEAHEAFMTNRGLLDQERINELAAGVGIDVEQMLEDMKAPEITGMLAQYSSMARAVGISGTPAFLINGTLVSGADMERVNALVDAGLKDAS